MKGTLAWFIFGLAALTCLLWIGFGVRDDLREDDVFHDIIEKRMDIAESPGEVVHIGVAGDWKHHGDILQGITLAAEELNDKGGILGRTVSLVPEDDHGTVDGALEVAQSFASRPEIAFVIGHTRLRLNADVAQNYEFYGIMCLSPNAANAHSSANTFSLLFENGMSPRQTGRAILELAQRNGWTRLGLLYAKSDHAMRQARQFESMANKHEIRVPLSFGYEGRGSGIAQHMERWKRELDLDAMVLAVDEADTIPLIAACRVIGIDCPFIVVREKPASLNTAASELGTLFFLKQPAPTQATTDLTERCQKTYGHGPKTDTLLGYDALSILAQAITKAGTFVPADVAQSLKGAQIDTSVSGTLRFDEHGTAIKGPMEFRAD